MTMPDSQRPGRYDAVLGNVWKPPTTGAVLGGVGGIRHRFQSHATQDRIAAVLAAPNYGEAGVDLLIEALRDSSLAVQRLAYRLLQANQTPTACKALQTYDAYALLECFGVLRGHQGGITAVALSGDGRSLVSAGRDAVIRVWDVQYQEEYLTIPEPRFIYAIAISSDNRIFTAKATNSTLKAWDLRTGQPIDAARLPTRGIASVAVSPSRQQTTRHLISGSQNTIKIWNLQIGREVATLRGHTSLVTAVAVAHSCCIVASGSEDRTIRLWGIGGDGELRMEDEI